MPINQNREDIWHQQSLQQVLDELEVDAQKGLTQDSVTVRARRYGLNEIEKKVRRGLWRIIASQFADFMIFVLVAAAVISGIVGEVQDTLAIVVIVLVNAVIGAVQEYRAERAVAALRKMSAPDALVLRNAEIHRIPATHLVPGDIAVLEAGSSVPADLRLIDSNELNIDESALTGESHAVEKITDVLAGDAMPLGDRRNMAYKGTLVTSGRGTGVAVAIGMATEIGKIATLLDKDAVRRTPLQQRLTHFGQRLGVAVLLVCAMIFVFGLMRGEPLALMFLTAVTLAVAAVPEALPAVVTVSLALGAHKMTARNALIRRLPAVETLGSVTCICADKTGTLTENRMQLDAVVVDGKQVAELSDIDTTRAPGRQLCQALALSNDARQQSDGAITGDPTEIALYAAALAAGFDKALLEQELPRVAELPFDAERQCMTTLHHTEDGVIVFIKGAPEKILALCARQLTSDGTAPLDMPALLAAADALAADGYRVLAYATRTMDKVPEIPEPAGVEQDLDFLGFTGLIDPPRPEAAAAVALCRSAGIRPVMITGDHAGTARAIAQRLGIAHDGDPVMTGLELDELSMEQLQAQVSGVPVYARVNPEQKIRIVQALQACGEFVAMTGDGVNDAPALRRAEIGVAMGRKGTDVAREAADMVLLDDNFSTIVSAVAEGRRIYDNIRKFVKDTMSSNSGEIWTLFLAPFFGLPIPLLPIHILWINLVTDGLPGLAFTVEPAEPAIMRRPPRPPQESIFAHGMWQHILWVGLFVGALSIGAQAWAFGRGVEYWQTVVFTVLTVSQLFHSLAVRSERESLFVIGLASNPAMLGAVVLTLLLQLAVIYVPVFNPIFHTQPLPLLDLLVCLGLSSLVLVAVELEKWQVRRGRLYAT